MTLLAGARLGAYEILAPLGAGGQGEVYRARHTKLGREAAIKVLRPELASDPARVKRFEQEARAASALNHPNIITIYDIVEKKDTHYIAMEYVDGCSVRELLADGPFPIGKLLDIAKQLGEGVAKAHSAGIVHRDLKPENLMVTRDGLVKILDFGLAKLLPDPAQAGSEMPTRDKLETRQGVAVGTVQYMSPEQAKGEPVDFRSDQFSMGAILYEMATGKPAFKRESIPQTQAAVIEDEPEPIAKLNAMVPAELTAVIERCLTKNPERRYPSSADLARELKNVPEKPTERRGRPVLRWAAVGFVAVSLAVALGWNLDRLRDSGAHPPSIESIAVLPLHNLTGDPEQDYFADGMTDALITNLAKIGALRVISRSSAMRYKETDTPLPEIARELDVDAVVEGTALRVEDRVRITAQLIDPDTDQALWAESYERDLRDVLGLQSEVARAVADAIQVRVAPEEALLLARTRPVDPEAHEAFLRAQYFSSQVPEGAQKAIEYFRLALEKDPEYADAYAGLAIAHHVLGFFGFMEPREAYARAKADALKSLELDETRARAHVALAVVAQSYDWDWPVAQTGYERAIDLDPNDVEARRGYGDMLFITGHFDRALAEARRVRELDPLSVLSGVYLASACYYSRRFDEAVELCQKTLEVQPDSSLTHWLLWLSFHQKGMLEEATTAYANYVYADILSSPALSQGRDALERAHTEGGYAVAMRMGAEELERQWEQRGDPLTIALSYLHAGANDNAFRWLERAYERREPALPLLVRASPDFEPIRSDPRFQDLLRRMNFPS